MAVLHVPQSVVLQGAAALGIMDPHTPCLHSRQAVTLRRRKEAATHQQQPHLGGAVVHGPASVGIHV